MEIAVSTAPAHVMLTRKKNTWYSVRDGNWNDPNIWMSNALDKRAVTMPRAGDDVYILHNVLQNVSTTVNNLYVQGKLTSANTSLSLSVNGDLQASGTIDLTGSNTNLLLYGYNNFINSFTAGNSTVTYTRNGDQNVMDLGYKNLTIGNNSALGIKRLTSDLTTNSNLSILSGTLEAGSFNLTVMGTTSVTQNGNGTLSKTGSGSMLFIGAYLNGGNVSLTGNPTLEFRNGITVNKAFSQNFGTGILSFTTNSQTFNNGSCGAIADFNNPIIIVGAITVTMTSSCDLTTPIQFNNIVDGTNSLSTMNIVGAVNFNNSSIMNTLGIVTYTSTAKTGFIFNGNFTLPTNLAGSLITNGTGTKTIASNSSLVGLTVNGSSTFELSTFDLTLSGLCNVGSNATFSKSGSGSLIFVGSLSLSGGTITFTGNPTLEFRGGINFNGASIINFGTSDFNFTVNNQNITNVSQGAIQTVSNNWIINGAITLTVTGNPPASGIILTGTLNGTNSSSTFISSATTGFNYQNVIAPMTTGKLLVNQVTNLWIYGKSGNQNIQIPSDSVPGYKNLTLQGSGIKKLLGNISVKGTYNLTAPAILDSNGFTLTNP